MTRSVTSVRLGDESKWKGSHGSMHTTGRKSNQRASSSRICSRKVDFDGRGGNAVGVDAHIIIMLDSRLVMTILSWWRTGRGRSTELESPQQNASAGVDEEESV